MTTATPIALQRRTGAEWTKHVAGRGLADRAAQQRRAAQDDAWREVAPFIPCG